MEKEKGVDENIADGEREDRKRYSSKGNSYISGLSQYNSGKRVFVSYYPLSLSSTYPLTHPPPTHPSIHLFTHPPIQLSVHRPSYPAITGSEGFHLFIHLSTYPPIFLPVRLSLHLAIQPLFTSKGLDYVPLAAYGLMVLWLVVTRPCLTGTLRMTSPGSSRPSLAITPSR